MPSSPVDPRNTFGPAAERYATSAVHGSRSALERLIDIAKPDGGLVLDIATGSGHTAMAFAGHVDKVVATDITLQMIEVCRRKARERGLLHLEVCFAQAAALPFRNASFDGVTCRLAPHHFESVETFVKEVYRVLKPDGWFLLVDTTGSEDAETTRQIDAFERLRDPSHVSNLSMSAWRSILEGSEFRIKVQEEIAKQLEFQDWMDRTATSPAVQKQLKDILENAHGELRAYLNPHDMDSTRYFELREGLFFSDK